MAKRNLKYVSSWKDLYKKVCELASSKLPKIHIILDTDTDNEVDDQFALGYLLQSRERFYLDSVTIAPYYHDGNITIKEGIDKSYKACKEIFELSNIEHTNILYKGSTDYFKNGYLEETDAIKKMVEVINNNTITYIVAIGSLTNIAVLLKLYPEVKDKIKLVWLGGHSIMSSDNYEYNFRQDVEAVKSVFNSGIDIKVIPCNGVASNLMTSIYELDKKLDDHPLNRYLCNNFYNDGKHGDTPRRVIWDISVIAYFINPYWFEFKRLPVPKINDDLSYEFIDNDKTIDFAVSLNNNEIYNDLFKKMSIKKP